MHGNQEAAAQQEGRGIFLDARAQPLVSLCDARADDAKAALAVMSQSRMVCNRDFSVIHGIDIESAHGVSAILQDVSDDQVHDIVRLGALTLEDPESRDRSAAVHAISSAISSGLLTFDWLQKQVHAPDSDVPAETQSARWSHQRLHAARSLAPDLFDSQEQQAPRQSLGVRSARGA